MEKEKILLQDLLKGVTKNNIHSEFDWGNEEFFHGTKYYARSVGLKKMISRLLSKKFERIIE
ncbi:MAG: hypothetical protein HQL25_08495 [Candidatus Omnitrophica bacterium]|nr:hypothetical protein [Candidatus Omnitrophota bacterium]